MKMYYSECVRKVQFIRAVLVPKPYKRGVNGWDKYEGVYSLSGCMKPKCDRPNLTCAQCRYEL